jgi:hypothetical protein
VRVAGEHLDVEGLGEVAIDPVADPSQPHQVTQTLRLGGRGRHATILSRLDPAVTNGAAGT